MIRALKLSRNAWFAGLAVVALMVGSIVLEHDWRFDPIEHLLLSLLATTIVFATSALAGYDSGRIGLRRYKSVISYGPIGIFVICALFFPFALLWYLVVRIRIKLGKMPLKSPPPMPVSETGLLQPWRQWRV